MSKIKAGTSKADAAYRRLLYAEAYLTNGGNKTQAALTAGFAPGGAERAGIRLSGDSRVKAIIDARRAEIEAKAVLTTDETLRELAKIVRADLRKLFNEDGTLKDPKDWPEDTASAIASIEVLEEFEGTGKQRKLIGYTKKVKLWDKNQAIEKAMRHLGLFEKDNAQKTDPFAEMLARIQGSGLKPVRIPAS